MSLSVHFIKSTFRQISIVNLNTNNQGKLHINIVNSTFDDERINLSHNKCPSVLRLYGAKVSIINTNFSNIDSGRGLIDMSSSTAVFRRCIFRRIKSYLSTLMFKSNSVSSFHTCSFENIVTVGRFGAIFLQQSQGLFEGCTFGNNTSKGGYGGAISVVFGSILNALHGKFKWNKAADSGGAVFSYQPLSVNILDCFS